MLSISSMVDYDDLPAVVDVEEAAKGGTVIYESFGDNIAYRLTAGEGDIDAALNGSDHVLKQRIIHQRLAPIAMEGRGVLARYFPGEEELTVWSSTQIPHLLRTQLALMIGIPENKLRVITPEVGGGFGSKLNVYAEEALLGWISMQLAKPVKWIEGAARKYSGHDPRTRASWLYRDRMQKRRHHYRTALQRFCRPRRLSSVAHARDSNVNRTDAFRVLTRFRRSRSTSPAASPTRCRLTLIAAPAGRKRLMSLSARWIWLPRNSAWIRPKSGGKTFPRADEFPFHTATGLDYDSGNYEAALDKAQEMVGYDALREEQKKGTRSKAGCSASAFQLMSRFARLGLRRQCPPVVGKARRCELNRPAKLRS